ncbi:winged helix DNA-binding domain-containing protein, partial [bacterium]|nr:winged helix DNA-binding domain-containing protein [bacterium]
MKKESISLKEAQALILSSQKLVGPILSPLEIIEHLGYVQIDTISVIERAHHHVFWTRNQRYRPTDLDELVKSRKVFEYWSHAASYLPMNEYRFSLPMNEYRFSLPMKKAFQNSGSSWFPRDIKLMSAVLKRIQDEGALRSKDFQNIKKGNTGWWDWKPAKKALERLFLEGSLEITRRDGFQKVYDLPERVIPSSINTTLPSDTEYIQFLIERTLRHHGLANINEMAY